MPLSGKRVLVHAGAGGVGSFAIQVRNLKNNNKYKQSRSSPDPVLQSTVVVVGSAAVTCCEFSSAWTQALLVDGSVHVG